MGQRAILVCICAGVGLAGCSGSSLPALPPPVTTGTTDPSPTISAPQNATDLYAIIARKALQCWFGPNGLLTPTHIFNAEAAPESKGGNAEITIHERDPQSRDPRGLRAYRIAISQTMAGGATAVPENLRMPEPAAERMAQDVKLWSQGKESCATAELVPPVPFPDPQGALSRKNKK
jgi:hypothetical protein